MKKTFLIMLLLLFMIFVDYIYAEEFDNASESILNEETNEEITIQEIDIENNESVNEFNYKSDVEINNNNNNENNNDKKIESLKNENDVFEENNNLYGLQYVDNEYYYFDNNGNMIKGIVRDDNDNLYYFDQDTGIMQKGWITYNGNTYYADLETGKLKRLINEVDGNSYFFGRTGAALQKGTINYYDDLYLTDDSGVLQSGIQYINGKAYLFGDDYKAETGWIEYKDNKYYADKNSKQLYNLIHEVDGELYFFGRTQYRVLKGWIDYDGKTYYADLETGKLKRLINEVDGDSYFFGRTGAALQKGLIEYYGDYYYANEEGKLQKDLFTFENRGYLFGDDYKAETGWIEYKDNKYYADPNNKQLYNLIHVIDGKAYFFGRTQYRVLRDWISYNGSTYYANLETGELAVGSVIIDGVDYYFDNGYKLQSGWKTINGSTYYLYSDLTKAQGLRTINGTRYMFDSNGVLMYSNVKVYIDISSHQGDIDFDKVWNSGQIDGIILRAGYWDSEDKYFKYYIQEIKRLAIPYTVYLYSYAHDSNEALVEANNMVNILKKYDLAPSLNVYYDIEGYDTGVQNSDDISISEYQNIALNFINYLAQNGYEAKIYSYYYFALTRFNAETRNYLDWIAKYTSTNNYPYSWRGWQFTDSGSIPGISGNVDMSIFLY